MSRNPDQSVPESLPLYYEAQDDRVRRFLFCSVLDTAFLEPCHETTPLADQSRRSDARHRLACSALELLQLAVEERGGQAAGGIDTAIRFFRGRRAASTPEGLRDERTGGAERCSHPLKGQHQSEVTTEGVA